MTQASLILIYGKSAVGKSYLAQKLHNDLKVPLLSLDVVKEGLFDSGFREDGGALNMAVFRAVTELAQASIEMGQSLIVDVHVAEDLAVIDTICRRSNAALYPIKLVLPNESLRIERYNHRIRSGNRHIGHGDVLKKNSDIPRAYEDPLVPWKEINMTDLADSAYTELVKELRSKLEEKDV